MYLKDTTEVLREQIFVLDKDFNFLPVSKPRRTDGTAFKSSPMQAAPLYNIDKPVRQSVFSCKGDNQFWNDCNPSVPGSFVGCFHLFSDNTARTMTNSAFVAYPIHVVLLNTFPVRIK